MEVYIAIFIATVLVLLVIGLLFRHNDQAVKKKWDRIAPTLRCPSCGTAYEKYELGSWACERQWSNEKEALADSGGTTLKCLICQKTGFVMEFEKQRLVYLSLDEAAEAHLAAQAKHKIVKG